MASTFVDRWLRERIKILWTLLGFFVPYMGLAWLVVANFDMGLIRYSLMAVLLLAWLLTVLAYRNKLNRLSDCPACSEPLFAVLAAKKHKLKVCPCCGHDL